MSLKEKIQAEMKDAMRAKDALKLQAIRLIWNGVRKKEIDDRKDLDDAAVEKVLLTLQKQNQESLEQARTAAREDAIAELEIELKTLKSFLPEAMSADDLNKIVVQVVADLKASGKMPAGGAGMGMAMKEVMAKVGSRADGKSIQTAVKTALGT